MNNILKFKPFVESEVTLNANMFDIEYNHGVEGDNGEFDYYWWAILKPKAAYQSYFKETSAQTNSLWAYYPQDSKRGIVEAKFTTQKNVQITVKVNLSGNGNSNPTGSIDSFVPTSFMNPGNQFDGHLTKDSFTITLDVRKDGIDLGEYYYSYRAFVVVKPDLQSFFVHPVIANTNYTESDYGAVEYSTSVTFTTKKSEEVTVYLTLNCNNGSGSITFDGVSPQWIDTPARPRLLKYGSKLIKIDIPTFYVWANEGGYHFADGKDPHPFFYTTGMTWRQWVASAYNPAPESIYIRGNNIMFNEPYIIETSSAIQDNVKPDDVIDPNHHYWLCDE